MHRAVDTRVVDEDVDASRGRNRRGECLLDTSAISDIDGEAERRLESSAARVESVGIAVPHNDRATFR
jgi:hypothetical protein